MTTVVLGPKAVHLRSFLIVSPSIIIVAISNGVVALEVADISISASVFSIVVTTPEEVVYESAKLVFRGVAYRNSDDGRIHRFCKGKTQPTNAAGLYSHDYEHGLSSERYSVCQWNYDAVPEI